MSLANPFTIINDFKTKNLIEKSVLLLIFLFPILSLSVRHWLSGIFSILALLSVIYLFKKHDKLYTEEKILLWIFFAFIFSFILSATLNDWTYTSLKRIDTESKYLLFFPLYIFLRQFVPLRDILLTGSVLGGLMLGLQALYDVYFTTHERGWGIYGPIILGDLSVLFFSFSTCMLIYNKPKLPFTVLLIVSIFFSVIATYLSGTRNAWLALFISLPILLFFLWQSHKSKILLFTYIFLISITLIISAFSVTSIKGRAVIAYDEINLFIRHGAPDDYNLIGSAVGFRLEQWRVATKIFQNAPFFGYGGGNAGKQVNQYVEKGLAHKDLFNPKAEKSIGGLHSTYFDTLVNEGLIGLIMLFIFLLYPLFTFITLRKYDQLTSSLGLLLIINYMIFGATENPFIYDNFSSVYLIFLAVLFSDIVAKSYKAKMTTEG